MLSEPEDINRVKLIGMDEAARHQVLMTFSCKNKNIEMSGYCCLLSVILQPTDLGFLPSDFGMSETAEMPKKPDLMMIKGTLQYMAPEVLKGKEGALSPTCDMWSAGVVMYVLLFGSFPFEGETREELLKSIDNGLDEKKLKTLERGYVLLAVVFFSLEGIKSPTRPPHCCQPKRDLSCILWSFTRLPVNSRFF